MKKALGAVGALLALVVLGVVGLYAYVSWTWDQDYGATELPALTASSDPEVVKRGEYLVHAVAHCSVCHAPKEVTLARKPGEHPAMTGGYVWKMGPLGTLRSRNITADPDTGIGRWSDAELARALKWGVGRDGKLLTFMSFGCPPMADEDLRAVVSYLRQAPAARNAVPGHEVGIVLKWLSGKIGPEFRRPYLERLEYVPASEEASVPRGEYLARGAAWCVSCHTSVDLTSMRPDGPEFAGSAQAEPDPTNPEMGIAVPNLTPDPDTGHIARWSEDEFVARLKAGRVLPGSKMPWEAYREMTDADLRSLYRFLRTLPPSRHAVGPIYRKR